MQLLDQCPADARTRIVVHLFRRGPKAQSRTESLCLDDRVSLGASQIRSRYFADHVTTLVFLLPPRGGASLLIYDRLRKAQKLFGAFITPRNRQEGFDWDGTESRSETDCAAIAIYSISREAVGVAN